MPLVPPVFHVLLLAGSAATTAVLAGYALYRRREPGVLPFGALMLAVTVWTASFGAGLATPDPQWRVLLESAKWFGAAFVPVTFLLFALEYTGHDERVTPWTVGLLSVVPLVTIALVWTNPWHGLIWMDTRVLVRDGIALLKTPFGAGFWVFMLYAWLLVVVGSALIVRLVFISDYLYADQSALLLAGVAVPVVGNVVSVFFEQPFPGIDLAPYSFVFTGLALAYALFSRDLFDLVPATRRLGRNAAIGQLDEGVVIVDTADRIIYLNPAAADLLDCESADAIGEPVQSFVDESALDFGTGDALADWERGDRAYSLRTSPITDESDRLVGHTLVIQDITGRKRREQRLSRQRDELERVNELNSVIRGVNQALVSATSREEIVRTVCERVTDSDRYAIACAADIPTWNGNADRWTVAGADGGWAELPSGLTREGLDTDDGNEMAVTTEADADSGGTWSVVPLLYGRTVYGALALFSPRTPAIDGGTLTVTDREREVLAELGELIGHAINAVENRRLLAAEAVVELEFRSTDAADPLVVAATETGADLTVTGFVPDAGTEHLAYISVGDGDAARVADALSAASSTEASVVGSDTGGGDDMLEWSVTDQTLVGTLVDHGANVLEVTVEDGVLACDVELASDAAVRALVERVQQSFPDAWLEARRERERPAEQADSVPDPADDLTDRQQEVLEIAYRAGYFDWPREHTAEEVADRLDISSPTFHQHLRRSEETLVANLFDAGDE